MTALPPTYYLHVWWARRPLVASRAAIMASLLPATADRDEFMHVLGIHGNPVETRRKIDRAKRTGEDLGLNPYGYERAFQFCPDRTIDAMFDGRLSEAVVVDPTAGGGSIPFEARRIGISPLANDLNPVAAIILYATLDYPFRFQQDIVSEFKNVKYKFLRRASERLKKLYPHEGGARVDAYLWARTIACPYCAGSVPLSPNWKLAAGGTGIRLIPKCQGGPGSVGRICEFSIVERGADRSEGTVSGGDATCPYPDCQRVIDGDEIKRQAQAGSMGDQLFAIVLKRPIQKKTRTGKAKTSWERAFRTPGPNDDNLAVIRHALNEKLPEWETRDLVPGEGIPEGNKTDEPLRYGMRAWRDVFSPRQLLGHGTTVEIFHDMAEEDRIANRLTDLRSSCLCLPVI